MKTIKSERLRKLEAELKDLEQWMHLGLVPKKDLERHREEIRMLQAKIEEERERLQFLKEGGDEEEFIAPKRGAAGKPGFSDVPTVPDVDLADSNAGMTTAGFDMETYITEDSSTIHESEEEIFESEEGAAVKEEVVSEVIEEEDDESYFSDKNRWRRGGGIMDPDADEW